MPEAIARIDFINGPYAAMYPGNSMGGVLLVTTKTPDKFEADIKQTVSVQPCTNTTPIHLRRHRHQHVRRQPQRPPVMVRRGEFPR